MYTFRKQIVQIVDECPELSVARAKLDWWREELKRLFIGQPQHPVCRTLAVHISHFRLPQEYFQGVIDGVAMDMDHDGYPSFKELSLYCQQVGNGIGLLAAQILGYQDRRTTLFVSELSMALQLVQILRNVRVHAVQGRFYLPAEEMEHYGVDPADLIKSHTPEPLRQLFKFQAERARAYHRRALQQLPEQDCYPQRSQIILAELAMRLLEEIETDGYRLLEHRISLTPLRKFWIAWWAVRREHYRYHLNKSQ